MGPAGTECLIPLVGTIVVSGAAGIWMGWNWLQNRGLPPGAHRYKGQLVLPPGAHDEDRGRAEVINLDNPRAPQPPRMPDIFNGESWSSKN